MPATVGASQRNDQTRGLWYAFTAGSTRVIIIANDDICGIMAQTPPRRN